MTAAGGSKEIERVSTATIRGQLVRDAAIANAQRRDKQRALEDCIAQTTREYTLTPSPSTRRHLKRAKMELNALFTSQAEYTLQRLKGHHYEHGEKAGQLLATELRQREAALAISALHGNNAMFIAHPQAIADEFGCFYQTLYTLETVEDQDKLTTLFEKANIPSLSEAGRALLEGDISKEEIEQAIAKLPYHKAPGEGGFSAEFHKWTERIR
ncbi:hypothetical protein NDU88_005570 [Pleurodeles waltl]|uniref:Uncharacterized protein n=1 Tax=Pleurodeles waltl TaxID=8319 RepID=A0AAV7PFS8_PLEWA|nr:hypothetical protein NDU88_005570 [Pleurodeles waltl]